MSQGAIEPLDPPFSLAGKRVWVAGHRGMVGRALMRRLEGEDCVLLSEGRARLDLRRQAETEAWMAAQKPDVVIIAAARVGGIHANNSRPAEFIYDNLALLTNIVGAAAQQGIEKLLLLGSSCIYPREAPQPMPEEALLSGPLEPTNQWYAVAKIAGVKLCQAYRRQGGHDFIAAMPTNLYGPGDNFELESSHVIPALIRKIHDAKAANQPTVTIWGSGRPLREFLHVDDCADALVHLLKHYSGESQVNIGYGEDVSIEQLARSVAAVIGYEGGFSFDTSKPDGTPRKLLDSDRLRQLGWRPKIDLETGLRQTYAWLLEQGDAFRGR